MTTESRAAQGARPRLVHDALLYRNRQELEGNIRDFLSDAAAADEPVLALLPSGNLEWLPDALGDLARTLRFEDVGEVGRNPNLLLSVMQEWTDTHDGRARVISEPVWPGRSWPEIVECLRHEALLNHALADAPATILCPYDAEHLDAETLAGAELTHARLVTGDGVRPSPRYGDPKRVHMAEQWPLQTPVGPLTEHRFEGDLHAFRLAVADDPAVRPLRVERREDLVFAINEAVSNAVRHGDGHCRTRIWKSGSSVVSEVRSKTTVSDSLAGRVRPLLDATDGRGLWLINQVCDLVELRSGEDGMTLRMHVHL
jgi:hypothetical protein